MQRLARPPQIQLCGDKKYFSNINQKLDKEISNLIRDYDACEYTMTDGTQLQRSLPSTHLKNMQYSEITNTTCSSTSRSLQISRALYKKYNTYFLTNETWNKFFENTNFINAEYILISLKKAWLLHGAYSHYTSTGLIKAADTLIKIKNKIIETNNNLYRNQKFLSTNNGKIYRKYLIDLSNWIDQEQNLITESMYARWELASHNHNFNDNDLTCRLIEDLLKSGVSVNIDPIKKGWLNSDIKITTYASYLYHIREFNKSSLNANTDLRNIRELRLRKLTRFLNDDNLTTKMLEGSHILIPSGLSSLVPKSRRWPQWLFLGHNKRVDFFQNENNQNILLNLTFKNNTDINSDDQWPRYKDNYDLLIASIKNTEKHLVKGFFAIFRRKTNTMLLGWRNFLIQEGSLILSEQLETITKTVPLIHFSKEPAQSSTEENIYAELTSREKNRYVDLISQAQQLHALSENHAVRSRLQYGISKLQSLVNMIDRISRNDVLADGMSFLAKGVAMPQDCFERFKNIHNSFKKEDDEDFAKTNKKNIEHIYYNAIELLTKKNISELISTDMNFLEQYSVIFKYTDQITAKINMNQIVIGLLDKLRIHVLKISLEKQISRIPDFTEFKQLLKIIEAFSLEKSEEYFRVKFIIKKLEDGANPDIFIRDSDLSQIDIQLSTKVDINKQFQLVQKCKFDLKQIKGLISDSQDLTDNDIEELNQKFDKCDEIASGLLARHSRLYGDISKNTDTDQKPNNERLNNLPTIK